MKIRISFLPIFREGSVYNSSLIPGVSLFTYSTPLSKCCFSATEWTINSFKPNEQKVIHKIIFSMNFDPQNFETNEKSVQRLLRVFSVLWFNLAGS